MILKTIWKNARRARAGVLSIFMFSSLICEAGEPVALRASVEFLPASSGRDRGLVILFPGGGMASSVFTDVPGRNIAKIFQDQGLSVLLPNSPILELGDRCLHEECGFLQQWGVEAYAKAYFEAISPWVRSAKLFGKPVIVGGWSLGAVWASLMIQQAPDAFDALIFWESLIYSKSPEVHRINGKYKIPEKGVILDQTEMRSTLGKMLSKGRLDFIDKVLIQFLATQRVGLYTRKFAYAAGSIFGLKYSDSWVAANTYNQVIPYESKQIMVDYLKMLSSDQVAPAWSRLGQFRGKIIAFGGGRGFGSVMSDSLELFSSASDIQYHLEDGFGHADHFGSKNHESVFVRPLREWLESF